MSSTSIREVLIIDPPPLVASAVPSVDNLPTGPYTARSLDYARVLTGTKPSETTTQQDVIELGEKLLEHLASLKLPLSRDSEFPTELRLYVRGLGDDAMLKELGREPGYKNAKLIAERRKKFVQALHANKWGPDAILEALADIINQRLTHNEAEAAPVVLTIVPDFIAPTVEPAPQLAVVVPKVRIESPRPLQPTRPSQRRDHDGAMDEWDIAELIGMPRKQVRALIKSLESSGAFRDLADRSSKPIARTRESGQKTDHNRGERLAKILDAAAQQSLK